MFARAWNCSASRFFTGGSGFPRSFCRGPLWSLARRLIPALSTCSRLRARAWNWVPAVFAPWARGVPGTSPRPFPIDVLAFFACARGCCPGFLRAPNWSPSVFSPRDSWSLARRLAPDLSICSRPRARGRIRLPSGFWPWFLLVLSPRARVDPGTVARTGALDVRAAARARTWFPWVFSPRALLFPGTSSRPGPLDVLLVFARSRGFCCPRFLRLRNGSPSVFSPRDCMAPGTSAGLGPLAICSRTRARAEPVFFGFFAQGPHGPCHVSRPGPPDLLAAACARNRLPSVISPMACVVPGTVARPGAPDVLAAARARKWFPSVFSPRFPLALSLRLVPAHSMCSWFLHASAELLPLVFARAELVFFGFFASGLHGPCLVGPSRPSLDLLASARARGACFLRFFRPGPAWSLARISSWPSGFARGRARAEPVAFGHLAYVLRGPWHGGSSRRSRCARGPARAEVVSFGFLA